MEVTACKQEVDAEAYIPLCMRATAFQRLERFQSGNDTIYEQKAQGVIASTNRERQKRYRHDLDVQIHGVGNYR